jgi:hypothetical protein
MNMKKLIILLLPICMSACMKEAREMQKSQVNPSVYYTNTNSALYVVEFINLNTKKVFTTILSPGKNSEKLDLPAFLTTGYYNVVFTPEGAYAHVKTDYIVGGISGSTETYPQTISQAYLVMGDPGSVSITLH